MKILLINRDHAFTSPRSRRVLDWLKDQSDITVQVVTFGPSLQITDEATILPRPVPSRYEQGKRFLFKMLGCYGHVWRRAEDQVFENALQNHKADVIFCQSLDLLPYAIVHRKNAKILFDAREYYPDQGGDSWRWRLLHQHLQTYLCTTYMPQCDGVITVSDPIADLYKNQCGVSCTVIPSMPAYYDGEPSPVLEDGIPMIHHGSCARSRRLLGMIDLVACLDERFSLTFMLLNDDPKYLEELKRYALSKGVDHRIFFKDPVDYDGIIPTLNAYAIGLYLLPKSNRNQELALPNKFFDYVQARLMLAISPNPAMASYVNRYGLGLVGDEWDPKSLAKAMNDLTPQIVATFKSNSHRAAQDLCDRQAKDIFLEMIKRL